MKIIKRHKLSEKLNIKPVNLDKFAGVVPPQETVEINGTTWSAENAHATIGTDGTALEYGKDYFYPDNNEDNVADFGLLYTYEAALRITPPGWRMPDMDTARSLADFIGSDVVSLAVPGIWREHAGFGLPGSGGTFGRDRLGFHAVPAGHTVLGTGHALEFRTAANYFIYDSQQIFEIAFNSPRISFYETGHSNIACSVRFVKI